VAKKAPRKKSRTVAKKTARGKTSARKKKAAARPAKRKKISPSRSSTKWGGISSAAVERATGCSWDRWIATLDRTGCARMSHTEIASLMHTTYKVPGWWCQMVAVGYEQAKGLRKPHQQAGGYSASVSRTFPVSATRLSDAFSNGAVRSRWLAGAPFELRTVQKGRSVRGAWGGEKLPSARGTFRPAGLAPNGTSIIAVWITAKGADKASMQVQQDRLRDEADVAKAKKFWSGALDRLTPILTK